MADFGGEQTSVSRERRALSERATALHLGRTTGTITNRRIGKGVCKHPSRSSSLQFESTRQAHDVLRVDLGFECSQLRQIVSVDVDERRVGARVVSVRRRRVIRERSLRLRNCGKAFYRFFDGRNELMVVECVVPTKVNDDWIRSVVRLASSWVWPG